MEDEQFGKASNICIFWWSNELSVVFIVYVAVEGNQNLFFLSWYVYISHQLGLGIPQRFYDHPRSSDAQEDDFVTPNYLLFLTARAI